MIELNHILLFLKDTLSSLLIPQVVFAVVIWMVHQYLKDLSDILETFQQVRAKIERQIDRLEEIKDEIDKAIKEEKYVYKMRCDALENRLKDLSFQNKLLKQKIDVEKDGLRNQDLSK